jgi:hypothetical protein
MSNPNDEAADAVTRCLLETKGVTTTALRTQVRDAAKARILGQSTPALDAPIDDLVRAIVDRPTSADIASLAKAGQVEDAILELVLSAAQGKGEGRLERGMAVLRRKS